MNKTSLMLWGGLAVAAVSVIVIGVDFASMYDPQPRTPAARAVSAVGEVSLSEAEDQRARAAGKAYARFFDTETTFEKGQLDRAVAKGVTWLVAQQSQSGSWGNVSRIGGPTRASGHAVGLTALALCSLLAAGETPDADAVARGFEFLGREPANTLATADIAMSAVAHCATVPPGNFDTARRLAPHRHRHVAALVERLAANRGDRDGWGHALAGAAGQRQDLCSTHLVALALLAARSCGIEVPRHCWLRVIRFTLSCQQPEGLVESKLTTPGKVTHQRGMSYASNLSGDGTATGAMTACGIANLAMARRVLASDAWSTSALAAATVTAERDALAWLGTHFDPDSNPGGIDSDGNGNPYWSWTCSVAMEITRRRLFGYHNWFNEMGQGRLNRQYRQGQWDSKGEWSPSDVLDTCFSLLFLRRAAHQWFGHDT